jgi:hypothetical protein
MSAYNAGNEKEIAEGQLVEEERRPLRVKMMVGVSKTRQDQKPTCSLLPISSDYRFNMPEPTRAASYSKRPHKRASIKNQWIIPISCSVNHYISTE